MDFRGSLRSAIIRLREGPRGMIQFCGRTDVGRRRQRNEDSILVGDGMLVVCDGMGGHQAGDVASRLAGDTIAAFFSRPGTIPWPTAPGPTPRSPESGRS